MAAAEADNLESGPLEGLTKSVDQYEYIAVIIPGATLLFGLALILSDDLAALLKDDISIGTLVIFLIASFIVGHLVRAIGDVLEKLMWLGGMPTDWLPSNKCKLLDDVQRKQLEARLQAAYGATFRLEDYARAEKSGEWPAIVREVNAVVLRARRGSRVDAFNRTYGLMVGITVALAIDAILLWLTNTAAFGVPAPWPAVIAAVAALIALLRAHHFGRLYGRELFVQFLASFLAARPYLACA